MVQEIITWCSVHYDKGEKVRGESYEPILLPGWRAPRFIHLCEPCAKELFGELTPVVAELGDTIDKTPPPVNTIRSTNRRGKAAQTSGTHNAKVQGQVATKPRDTSANRYRAGVACPLSSECGHDGLFYKRWNLRSHALNRHDRELAAIEAEVGTTAEGYDVTHRCPHDECEQGFATGQGLASHLRTTHNE